MDIQDFTIRANWSKVPNDKKILIDLTDHKCNRIVAVLKNDGALWIEEPLAPNNIDQFLVVPNLSHVKRRKLKTMKPSSKKRQASPPLSKAS